MPIFPTMLPRCKIYFSYKHKFIEHWNFTIDGNSSCALGWNLYFLEEFLDGKVANFLGEILFFLVIFWSPAPPNNLQKKFIRIVNHKITHLESKMEKSSSSQASFYFRNFPNANKLSISSSIELISSRNIFHQMRQFFHFGLKKIKCNKSWRKITKIF
jgi:hypothetical protein